jgi:hypothetical protein
VGKFFLIFFAFIFIFGFQNCSGKKSDLSGDTSTPSVSRAPISGSASISSDTSQGNLVITTNILHPIVSGHYWNYNLEVTGAPGPVSWSIVSGALPVNMALDSKLGTINNGAKFNTYPVETNNVLAPGVYTFVVKANSGVYSTSKQLSFEVLPQNTTRPIIMDQIQPEIAINEYVYPGGIPSNSWPLNYNTFAGYYGEDSTCSLVSGQLPAGTSIQKFNGYAPCFLTGIARQVGTFKVIWMVQNQYGSDSRELTISVYNPTDTVTLTTAALPAARVGVPYSFKLQYTTTGNPDISLIRFGEMGSVLFSLGLSVDDRTGEITGTPSVAGNYTIGLHWGISTFAHESGSSTFTFIVNP